MSRFTRPRDNRAAQRPDRTHARAQRLSGAFENRLPWIFPGYSAPVTPRNGPCYVKTVQKQRRNGCNAVTPHECVYLRGGVWARAGACVPAQGNIYLYICYARDIYIYPEISVIYERNIKCNGGVTPLQRCFRSIFCSGIGTRSAEKRPETVPNRVKFGTDTAFCLEYQRRNADNFYPTDFEAKSPCSDTGSRCAAQSGAGRKGRARRAAQIAGRFFTDERGDAYPNRPEAHIRRPVGGQLSRGNAYLIRSRRRNRTKHRKRSSSRCSEKHFPRTYTHETLETPASIEPCAVEQNVPKHLSHLALISQIATF